MKREEAPYDLLGSILERIEGLDHLVACFIADRDDERTDESTAARIQVEIDSVRVAQERIQRRYRSVQARQRFGSGPAQASGLARTG